MADVPPSSSSGADLYWELSYAVTRLFTEASEQTAPMPAVMQLLGRRLGWDVVAFWRVDETRVLLVCVDLWHAADCRCEKFEKVSRARQFGFGEGLPGAAWKQRDVVWSADVTCEANFPRSSIAELEDLHAGVAFPVCASRRVLGVVELFSRQVRPLDVALAKFFQALGGQVGVFVERTLTRQSLAGAEAQFQLLAESASDAVFTIDEESTILFANSAVHRIFGYQPEELIGSKLTVVMPDYLRHVHEAGIRRYVGTGERHVPWDGIPLPGLHKAGHEIPLEISFGEFVRGGRRVFTGFCRKPADPPSGVKR